MHEIYFLLKTIADYHGVHCSIADIKHLLRDHMQFNRMEFIKVCKANLLKCKIQNIENVEGLRKILDPTIIELDGHYYIYIGISNGQILLHNHHGEEKIISAVEFEKNKSINIFLIKQKITLKNIEKEFNMGYFWGAIVKYKHLYKEILLASLFIQILAIGGPILFQVIIDKVIPYNSLSTLYVVVSVMVITIIFELLLSGIRTYMMTHTNSRIDVKLGMKLFRHLTKLPMSFFSSRPTGQVIARVQELDTIRSFLTDNALQLFLDLLFGSIYFILMYIYSEKLTIFILLTIPLYVIVSWIITPILKNALDKQFQESARSQTFLYESVSGIETVKTLALENKIGFKWEDYLGSYVKSSFKTRHINNIGYTIIQLISRLTTVGILFFGASLVFSGQMSIGELIAFNMFAGQVLMPIMRTAQVWQDFQQARISLARIGDILNSRIEAVSETAIELSDMEGNYKIESLSFKYDPTGKNILDDISLNVKAGEVIGLVGRSGSGKSTLTKMIQGLYLPYMGNIFLDGHNINTLNIAHMRSQIGTVLQESFLFSSSIKENILIGSQNKTMEDVIESAKISGAHDFIVDLPDGYDTFLEERGSNLSGGQRQRIAIARALINKPKVLIFDEATSALDYESERIIQENMHKICQDKTVFIVAHRLSSINMADKVYCFDKGKIKEYGTIPQLMEKDGLFAHLKRQQNI